MPAVWPNCKDLCKRTVGTCHVTVGDTSLLATHETRVRCTPGHERTGGDATPVKLLVDQLDGDLAVELRLMGAVDDPETAFAESFPQHEVLLCAHDGER